MKPQDKKRGVGVRLPARKGQGTTAAAAEPRHNSALFVVVQGAYGQSRMRVCTLAAAVLMLSMAGIWVPRSGGLLAVGDPCPLRLLT